MNAGRAGGLAALAACLASGPAAALEFTGENAGIEAITHARTYTLLIFDQGAEARREVAREALAPLGIDPETVPLTDPEQAAVVERFRIAVDAWVGEAWSASVQYDLIPIFGQFATEGLLTGAANPLRRWDLDPVLHADGDGDWTLNHNLDRVVLRYLNPAFEVRIGRQAIGFGQARLFNAADLFAALGPASIDSEFKGGIDGAHVIVPLNEFHEVGFIAVVHNDDLKKGMLLARWQGAFDGFDTAVMAGMTYAKPTVALSMAGDLGGAGWYLDASARFDLDDFAESPIRATAGLDYHFEAGIRLMGELHYNGAGAGDPDDYLALQQTAPYATGEVYLLGEYYAGALASFEVHPLVNIGVSWLQSLTDGSALVGPTVGWDFAQEVTLGAGALVPIGERITLVPTEGPTFPPVEPEVASEFGMYPLLIFTDLRLAL